MKPALLRGKERAVYVQGMFAQIAHRYDVMNRLMTFGQDVAWRREVIQRANLPGGGWLLDLGSGTGDLAVEALHRQPSGRVVAGDFTLEMMRVGQRRQRPIGEAQPDWCAADALNLPYANAVFDAVISGFLMRNVGHLDQALNEQARVLKPGGRIVILDTTQPKPGLLSPLIHLHMHVIIPWLGRLLSGAADAYRYLPDSTESFLSAEQLAARLQANGFCEVGFRRLNFGTIAIHWGRKERG
jgi:demethylmenaquinone methyltransferase/2-methoxy-6-polyprenyl-1,4-benzoquinol methylase